MKKLAFLFSFVLILGFSTQAFAYHFGDSITTLNDYYGDSWDWGKELWQVLDNVTSYDFHDLAEDVKDDCDNDSNTSPTPNYSAYKNSYWQTFYGSYELEIMDEVAGYKDENTFGWYEKDDVSWGELFEGSEGQGDETSFSNFNKIGFWLKPELPPNVYYYTDTTLNSEQNSEYALQAVTFYLGNYDGFGNEYLICFEDLNYFGDTDTDNDYQDMIVLLKDPTIPEPASLSLLGIGLLGLAGFKRKKKYPRN